MRVLLVEDDPAMAQSVELMLKSAAMVVDTTDLGEDGLEIGKLYDYDIIILDLMLPDMDGLEVLRRLRDARAGVRWQQAAGVPGARGGARRHERWLRACRVGHRAAGGSEVAIRRARGPGEFFLGVLWLE